MKIIIKGFRSHLDSEYLFRDGTLILLSGASGAGKSTVLQSIYWCMYGSMRNIYSNLLKSGKMSVTIQMKECTIYRQGRPNLLRVVLKNRYSTDINISNSILHRDLKTENTYEDEVAQGIIDRMFGSREVWKACSYIDQNNRCALLSGTNNERMDLLNKLSFSSDDPGACIDKIDVEIKSVREKFAIQQALYSKECEKFTQELEDRPVDVNVLHLLDSVHLLKDSLNSKQISLKDLERVRFEQMKLIGTRSMLIKSLDQKKNNHLLLKKDPDCQNCTIDNDKINELKSIEIPRRRDDLAKYRKEQIEYIRIRSSLDYASKDLEAKKMQLSAMSEEDDERLDLINSNISMLDIEIPKINSALINIDKYSQLDSQLRAVSKKLDGNLESLSGKYTMDDFSRVLQLEQIYSSNSLICRQLGIEYDNYHITETKSFHIRELQLEASMIPRINSLKQIRLLFQELSLIPSIDHDISIRDEQVLAARDEYVRLSQSSNLLSCPHCGNSVRYVDNVLHPESISPATSSQIKESLERVTDLYNRQNNQKKAVNLKSQIEALIPSCGDQNEVDQYQISRIGNNSITPQNRQRIISQLEQIVVVDKSEITSDSIRDIILYDGLKKQLADFPSDISIINRDQLQSQQKQYIAQKSQLTKESRQISLMKSQRSSLVSSIEEANVKLIDMMRTSEGILDRTEDIKILEQEISIIERRIDKYSTLIIVENEIKEIQKQLFGIVIIDGLEEKYAAISDEIETLKYQISSCEYANKMYSLQSRLENERNEIIEMTVELTDLQRLRQLAVDVECQQLQSTVDSINNAMIDILGNIFDDPITVRIQLQKQLKTTKLIKNAINLYISYRGSEYDSITQMSGGEGDRISFALILALNRVSPSPLLMLDESMSSINGDLREACLKSLRESVDITKTVLVVNHEDIEGHYDEVIRF